MQREFLDQNDQKLCEFIVPTEYCPSIDLISKIVLTDVRIVNIIYTTIVKAEKDSYVVEPLGFMQQNFGAVLYTPHSFKTDLPPIVINTIETFEEKKFNQIIQQYISISEQYNTLPICVIIVVQQLDEKIIEKSLQHHDLPLLREITCAFWAKQCILMPSNDIKLNKSKVRHHPLLDIIIAITRNEKVILCKDSL